MSERASNRMNRAMMVGMVVEALPYTAINDLPAIRQAINDLADSYRKDGWTVRDWDQDSVVQAVRWRMLDLATREAVTS